jgi:non-heme chloroperoxidase
VPRFTAPDGTELYYKDWGRGRPVVFSHGWPLNADDWDPQMYRTASRGHRAIAHDRRGHGRSEQPWHGNDMDTYADDLAALLDELNLRDVTLVGHSTGGGEVVRCLARHGTARVAGAVLVGAVPPLMLRTAENPDGLPREVFDGIRQGVREDRSQFYRDLSESFYGANRPGSTVSQGVKDAFWRLSMQAGCRAAYDCIAQFSETDFTDDLSVIDVPVLVVHGDDDQIVPIGASALRTADLLKDATLKVHEGAPHGLHGAYARAFDEDLADFLRR